jgi:hypothetical protein
MLPVAGCHALRSSEAATEDRFKIERLEESTIAAAKRQNQRSERSQEVVENKGQCFSHKGQSQEVSETKAVIRSKPRGC